MVTENSKPLHKQLRNINNENKHSTNLTVGRRISFGFPYIFFIRKQNWKT